MNLKHQFGNDLKIKVQARENVVDIGCWAHSVFLGWDNIEDDKFLDLLLELNTMTLGSEFALTYEELEQIAEDIIEGKYDR